MSITLKQKMIVWEEIALYIKRTLADADFKSKVDEFIQMKRKVDIEDRNLIEAMNWDRERYNCDISKRILDYNN